MNADEFFNFFIGVNRCSSVAIFPHAFSRSRVGLNHTVRHAASPSRDRKGAVAGDWSGYSLTVP
jgi:hypothetical protein